jgi:hypothetical protein
VDFLKDTKRYERILKQTHENKGSAKSFMKE